jgi:hypothetical protein
MAPGSIVPTIGWDLHQIIALGAPFGALPKTRALPWFYFKFEFPLGIFVQLAGVVNKLMVAGYY